MLNFKTDREVVDYFASIGDVNQLVDLSDIPSKNGTNSWKLIHATESQRRKLKRHIRLLMTMAGFSQEKLASSIGVSRPTVVMWFNNAERAYFRKNEYIQLRSVLNDESYENDFLKLALYLLVDSDPPLDVNRIADLTMIYVKKAGRKRGYSDLKRVACGAFSYFYNKETAYVEFVQAFNGGNR